MKDAIAAVCGAAAGILASESDLLVPLPPAARTAALAAAGVGVWLVVSWALAKAGEAGAVRAEARRRAIYFARHIIGVSREDRRAAAKVIYRALTGGVACKVFTVGGRTFRLRVRHTKTSTKNKSEYSLKDVTPGGGKT